MTVAEPTIEEASQIMQGIAKSYAEFHGVEISPEIARQCVVLSERYITDRFLPDKAIDLLDEACSDVNLRCREISRLAELNELLGRQTEPAAPRCGSCGAPVREGDLFCRECGGKL